MNLLAPYTAGRALAATIGATLAVIVGDRPRRIRRVFAVRIYAIQALLAALWRQISGAVEYAYHIGEVVWAPTHYGYSDKQRAATYYSTFRITSRRHVGGMNYYTLAFHAWECREDELKKFQHVIELAFPDRMTVAA